MLGIPRQRCHDNAVTATRRERGFLHPRSSQLTEQSSGNGRGRCRRDDRGLRHVQELEARCLKNGANGMKSAPCERVFALSAERGAVNDSQSRGDTSSKKQISTSGEQKSKIYCQPPLIAPATADSGSCVAGTARLSSANSTLGCRTKRRAGCLKRRLWRPADQAVNTGFPEIPLLCPEACNFFVGKAREKLKGTDDDPV